MSWVYKNKKVTSIPEGIFGFIYKLTLLKDTPLYPLGSIYIGKKQVNSVRKTKITKKEKIATNNNRKRFKVVSKPMDWENYWSSSKEVATLIEQHGTDIFKREIIEFVPNKYLLTFKEIEHMILQKVHEVSSLNGTIGRFFISKLKV